MNLSKNQTDNIPGQRFQQCKQPNAFQRMWKKFYDDIGVDIWNNFFFFLMFGNLGIVSIILNINFMNNAKVSVQRKAVCKSLLILVCVVFLFSFIANVVNICSTGCAINNSLHHYYY